MTGDRSVGTGQVSPTLSSANQAAIEAEYLLAVHTAGVLARRRFAGLEPVPTASAVAVTLYGRLIPADRRADRRPLIGTSG